MPDVTRRIFLGGAAATTAGLIVGCGSSGGAGMLRPAELADAADLGPWIMITPDDEIIVWSDKSEMGQGVLTLYASLVAEELEVDPARIDVRHATIDPRYGILQMTGGSRSASQVYEPLRRAGAEARERLLRAAAARWSVARDQVEARSGAVHDIRSGRVATYGALAEAAAAISPPSEVELKPAEAFQVIGRVTLRADAPAKVRGQARYGMDVRVEGMRYAAILRPPVRGDRVAAFDSAPALAIAGVRAVFEVPSGVAVLADHTWAARQGVAALAPTFERGDSPRPETRAIRAAQARLLDEERGRAARDDGDVEAALGASGRALDVRYFTPHQAHAAMEPLNCTIVPGAKGVDVHIGTQGPNAIQDVVSATLGLSRSDVRVHVEMLGGGFGRRSFTDVAAECAEIVARADVPVKLAWSREDDHAHDYYRPATGHRFRGSVDAEGRIEAWDHVAVAPSIVPGMAKGMAGVLVPESMRGVANAVGETVAGWIPKLMGPVIALEGASSVPYAAENVRVGSVLHDPGVRVGIWRSVGHSNNGFVVESFVDELAHAARMDPLAFRRRALASHPRHLACLDLVAERADWGRPAEGVSQGVAVHESFGSVVAHVAEVRVEGETFRVSRVVCAVDCGRAINPDVVRGQIAGGTIYGLTAAIKSAVTFEEGVPIEQNFDRYAMLRMDEAPEIEVYIVPSEEPPSGVGEPGTPGIAAAVANALFVATGQRLRELPLRIGT